jgi:hypothetical protein
LGTKEQGINADPPTWLGQATNYISFAFVDPTEIATIGDAALPKIMIDHAKTLKAQGMQVSISIGGATYGSRWTFLSSAKAAEDAAVVCAGWAKKYGVGIEIDYEGGGSWGVRGGEATVSSEMLNIGVFIEKFRELVPVGTGLLTIDVYAAQGGNPCLTYLINRYIPGMLTKTPDWITGGVPVTVVTNNRTLDFINIMVAGDDDAGSVQAYIDGYVGPKAQVGNKYNAGHILAPVPAGRVAISMIAGHSCAAKNSNLEAIVAYANKIGLVGIMQWAVGLYGCTKGNPHSLYISDWDCKFDPACPGLVDGKKSFLGANTSVAL